MSKTFFIADTHFGHEAIIAYERRPFANAAEMDAALIANWNSVVGKDDLVWMLGDFALAPAERVREVLAALHGKKQLIMGNHDRKRSADFWREAGFDWVSPYPVLDGVMILTHEPIYVNTNMPYCNIFGHVHGNPEYKDFSAQHACVSAERIGYAPIALEDVVARMQN